MSACEMLNLGEAELEALHGCVSRIVALGAEVAVVRARDGEIVAHAERDPMQYPINYDEIIAHRLWRVDLGVAIRRAIDRRAVAAEASRIDVIVTKAWERHGREVFRDPVRIGIVGFPRRN